MRHPLRVARPFAFAQTLAFLRRFVPCQRDFLLADRSLTAAVTIDGQPATFTITGPLSWCTGGTVLRYL